MSLFSSPACASVLCPPFFPSGFIYCFFTRSPFIKALPSHLSVPYPSSSSGQNRTDIFHILVHVLLQRRSSAEGITICDVIFSSLLISISSHCWADTPLAVGPCFSFRALWVRIQLWLPLSMMSFQFGCRNCRRKRKKIGGETQLAKTERRNANWLWWNPSGERWSVSPHILNQSGQSEMCERESAEVGKRPKWYAVTPTSGILRHLKTSLWPEYMEVKKGICWWYNGYMMNYSPGA